MNRPYSTRTMTVDSRSKELGIKIDAKDIPMTIDLDEICVIEKTNYIDTDIECVAITMKCGAEIIASEKYNDFKNKVLTKSVEDIIKELPVGSFDISAPLTDVTTLIDIDDSDKTLWHVCTNDKDFTGKTLTEAITKYHKSIHG